MSGRGTYEGLGDNFIVDIDVGLAEDARRLARYDEAVSLIEEFLRDGLEPQLARRAEDFLDTEPKEGRG